MNGLVTFVLFFSVESSTKCLKDEHLGEFPSNTYYCTDAVNTECCERNSEFTCCEPDSTKNV